MSLKVNIVLSIFFILFLVYHLLTLTLNPLPWFDEIFYASISKSFAETGRFIPEVSKEMWEGKENLVYGPIHFLLESFSYKLFGFGIFQYRIITFVFGILVLFITASLFRFVIPSTKWIIILLITFSLDPFTNLALHEGRMDLVSIFFMLASLLFLARAQKEEKNVQFVLSGIFAAVSVLTTPRSGIILVVMIFVFLFQLEGKDIKKSFLQLSLWLIPILLLYGTWFMISFGGLKELISYYQHMREIDREYLGGRFYIPKHEYLLIVLSILSVIYGIIKKGKAFFNLITIVSIGSIIAFYIVVVLDWGIHSIIILPFYYFLLFLGFYNEETKVKQFSIYPILLLFLFNLFFFSVKSAQVLSEIGNRNPELADSFVRKNIPKGSKVIGDAQYYYSVIKAGSDFRLFDQYLSDEDREQVLREVYDYDYLIISARAIEREPQICQLFLRNAKFQKVDELNVDASVGLTKKINDFGIVSNAERVGYNAIIFVRIKEGFVPLAYSKID